MTAGLALLAFVTLVAVLTKLGSGRVRGRGCCAPADPADDGRMQGLDLEQPEDRRGG